MSNERIDLTQFEGITVPELIAELKRCYEIIDGLGETAERLEVAEDVLGRSGYWDDVYYEELEERLYE